MSFRSSISIQLLRSILSIYFVITLTVTGVHMGVEYVHAKKLVQQELAGAEKTFYPALATALWEINHEQLEAIQRGIVQLPTISTVRIVGPGGEQLTSGSGDDHRLGGLFHDFSVSYQFDAQTVHLADVTFFAGGEVLFDRLRVGFQMILLNALIKSTALTLLFVWVFRRQLGMPLQQLTEAVGATDLDSLGRTRIDSRVREQNELKALEQAFNRMLAKLDQQRREHDASMAALNRNLERMVRNRTHELEEANRELERLATHDPLTGVFNRRHFERTATREIERAVRYDQPLSLLCVDLDHFKRINDSYGHAAGDAVLQAFVGCVGPLLRASDLLARIGGEEFSILLPNTSGAEAIATARRVLVWIREHTVAHGGETIRYSASIGVASLRAGMDYDALAREADEALYQAKRSGRDRVGSTRSLDESSATTTEIPMG